MIESRPGKNPPIKNSGGETNLRAFRVSFEHSTRRATVPVDTISLSPVKSRRHYRPAYDDMSDVAERSRVQYAANRLKIIRSTVKHASL